jgi:RNA polymerase subunit RPABC4/transcription elongation factor Spt4
MNVGNRDACGRCHTRHGGNNHYCPVHGPVSEGHCEPVCDWTDWVLLEDPDGRRAVPHLRADLPTDATEVPNSWRKKPTFRRASG